MILLLMMISIMMTILHDKYVAHRRRVRTCRASTDYYIY